MTGVSARAPLAIGLRGAAATGHHLATQEALRVLAGGGNAVDAALAAGGILAVVLPYACGLGGDAIFLIHDAASQAVTVLNGTGAAPAAATTDRFGGAIPPDGPLASTVPGLPAAFEDAQRRYATRPLSELLAPAITLAAEGFPAHVEHCRNLQSKRALLARYPAARDLFLPGNLVPNFGSRVVQADLARTLAHFAARGSSAFYRGDIARQLANEVQAQGGLMTEDDLAAHRSLWQEPLEVTFQGRQLQLLPPNSMSLLLGLQLRRLDRLPLSSLDRLTLTFAEIDSWREAHAEATAIVADPRHAESQARAFLAGILPTSPAGASVAPSHGSDTAGIVVADAAGNMVVLIQSITAPFGAGILVPGTGVLLNNRMPGFSLAEGHPNQVGPRKRPASTLCAAMVLDHGQSVLGIVTPGNVGQTCTLAQPLVRMLARGEAIETAVAAPRWSVGFRRELLVEDDMDPALLQAVVAGRDGAAAPAGGHTFGSVKVVRRYNGALLASADLRRCAATGAL